jgi:hypothetical protein
MTIATREDFRSREHVTTPRMRNVVSRERVSDVWPDWSTELSAAELAENVEKNRPSLVLREVAGAVVYSIGLVILLMAVLSVLHVR